MLTYTEYLNEVNVNTIIKDIKDKMLTRKVSKLQNIVKTARKYDLDPKKNIKRFPEIVEKANDLLKYLGEIRNKQDGRKVGNLIKQVKGWKTFGQKGIDQLMINHLI